MPRLLQFHLTDFRPLLTVTYDGYFKDFVRYLDITFNSRVFKAVTRFSSGGKLKAMSPDKADDSSEWDREAEEGFSILLLDSERRSQSGAQFYEPLHIKERFLYKRLRNWSPEDGVTIPIEHFLSSDCPRIVWGFYKNAIYYEDYQPIGPVESSVIAFDFPLSEEAMIPLEVESSILQRIPRTKNDLVFITKDDVLIRIPIGTRFCRWRLHNGRWQALYYNEGSTAKLLPRLYLLQGK